MYLHIYTFIVRPMHDIRVPYTTRSDWYSPVPPPVLPLRGKILFQDARFQSSKNQPFARSTMTRARRCIDRARYRFPSRAVPCIGKRKTKYALLSRGQNPPAEGLAQNSRISQSRTSLAARGTRETGPLSSVQRTDPSSGWLQEDYTCRSARISSLSRARMRRSILLVMGSISARGWQLRVDAEPANGRDEGTRRERNEGGWWQNIWAYATNVCSRPRHRVIKRQSSFPIMPFSLSVRLLELPRARSIVLADATQPEH